MDQPKRGSRRSSAGKLSSLLERHRNSNGGSSKDKSSVDNVMLGVLNRRSNRRSKRNSSRNARKPAANATKSIPKLIRRPSSGIGASYRKSLNQKREIIASITNGNEFSGPIAEDETMEVLSKVATRTSQKNQTDESKQGEDEEYTKCLIERGSEIHIEDAKFIVSCMQNGLRKPSWGRNDTDLSTIAVWLKSFAVFKCLDHLALIRIARALQVKVVKPLSFIYRQGDLNRNGGLFIIFSGSVEIFSNFAGTNAIDNSFATWQKPLVLTAGDSLGGAALADSNGKRVNNARAVVKSVLLQLSTDAVQFLQETESSYRFQTFETLKMSNITLGSEDCDTESEVLRRRRRRSQVGIRPRRGSVHTMVSENEEYIAYILNKKSHLRTVKELENLLSFVQHISIFQSLPKPAGLELCRYLKPSYLRPMEAVESKAFDSWYLLLKGSIAVYSKPITITKRGDSKSNMSGPEPKSKDFCESSRWFDGSSDESGGEEDEVNQESSSSEDSDDNSGDGTRSKSGSTKWSIMRDRRTAKKVQTIGIFQSLTASGKRFSQVERKLRCPRNRLRPSQGHISPGSSTRRRSVGMSFVDRYKRSSVAAIESRVAPEWKAENSSNSSETTTRSSMKSSSKIATQDGIRLCVLTEGRCFGTDHMLAKVKREHMCGKDVEVVKEKPAGSTGLTRLRSLRKKTQAPEPQPGKVSCKPERTADANTIETYCALGPCFLMTLSLDDYDALLTRMRSKETSEAVRTQSAVNIVHLCSVSTPGRDEEQLIKAEKQLGTIPFFLQLPTPIRIQLLKIAKLEAYDRNEVVVKQHDLEADKFYVVLCGSVSVCINEATPSGQVVATFGELRENFGDCVVILDTGKSFGEFAMLQRNGRSASVVAREYTCLLSIHYVDYARVFQLNIDFDKMLLKGHKELDDNVKMIMKNVDPVERTKQQLQLVANWARGVQFFQVVPEELLRTFCRDLSLVTLKDKEVLFRQGDQASHIYLVLSGSVSSHAIKTWDTDEVVRKLNMLRQKAKAHRRKTIAKDKVLKDILRLRSKKKESAKVPHPVAFTLGNSSGHTPPRHGLRRSVTETDLFYHVVQLEKARKFKEKLASKRGLSTEDDLEHHGRQLDAEILSESSDDEEEEEVEAEASEHEETPPKQVATSTRQRRNNVINSSEKSTKKYIDKFGMCTDVAIVGGCIGALQVDKTATSSLHKWRRKLTAIARGPTELCVINKHHLDKVIRENQSVISPGLIREITQKPIKLRSLEETTMLENLLLRVNFIKQISSKDPRVVHKLSQVVDFQAIATGVPVFTQGQVGDNFYIMLSGTVQIRKKAGVDTVAERRIKLKKIANSSASLGRVNQRSTRATAKTWDSMMAKHYGKLIVELTAGDSFGELALISDDEVRTASAVTIEPSQFLVLSKEVYNVTLKSFSNVIVFQPTLAQKAVKGESKTAFSQKVKIQGVRSMIEELPILKLLVSQCGSDRLDMICASLEYKSVAGQQILASRGEFAKNVLILVKGSCGLYLSDDYTNSGGSNDDNYSRTVRAGEVLLEVGVALEIGQPVTTVTHERCVLVSLPRAVYMELWPEQLKVHGRLQSLRESSVFQNSTSRELAMVLNFMETLTYRRHTVIPTEGFLILIRRGTCEVIVKCRQHPKGTHLTDLGDNEIFGEEECVAFHGNKKGRRLSRDRDGYDEEILVAKSNVELYRIPVKPLVTVAINSVTLDEMLKSITSRKAWRMAFLSHQKVVSSAFRTQDLRTSQQKLRQEMQLELEQLRHERRKQGTGNKEDQTPATEFTIPPLDLTLRKQEKRRKIRGNVFAGDSWMDVHLQQRGDRCTEVKEQRPDVTMVPKVVEAEVIAALNFAKSTKVSKTPMLSKAGRKLSVKL